MGLPHGAAGGEFGRVAEVALHAVRGGAVAQSVPPAPHRLHHHFARPRFFPPPVFSPSLLTCSAGAGANRGRKKGWSSNDRRDFGTYRGSWTFFEAGLCAADRTTKPAPKCLIGRNIHASSLARKHVVVWDWDPLADADSGGDDAGAGDDDADSGDGSRDAFNRASKSEIRELLRHIKPGDHIAVYPMARYSGWVNHVISVEINVYYFAF